MTTTNGRNGKAPAFQFYSADWLADEHVRRMSLCERGLYFDLLCFAWREGSIPDDTQEVARMVGSSVEEIEKCWPRVRSRFRVSRKGRLINVRLKAMAKERVEYQKRASAAGKKAAKQRWENDLQSELDLCDSHTDRNATAMRNDNTASASASAKKKNSWLTPYGEAWKKQFGGELPFGQAAKVLKTLEDEHGHEKTLAHFLVWLPEQDPKFVNLSRFEWTFGSWSPDKPRTQEDPLAKLVRQNVENSI